MNKYSCWKLSYSKRYYITHPWVWFKDIWRCIRDAWRRSVYGWTWVDCWNFDHWFMNIAPDMLRHIADHGSGYPGREPFDTPEKWHDWLHQMADLIETGREDWQDDHNEYYDEYINALTKKPWTVEKTDENGCVHHILAPITELDKKYLARTTELSAEGEKNMAFVMQELGKHWYDLWD